MQNCEETETNLQLIIKGNQIKNFSKKRFKTSQTRLQHTQAVEKMYPEQKPSSGGSKPSKLQKFPGLARLSGCNLRLLRIGVGCKLVTSANWSDCNAIKERSPSLLWKNKKQTSQS